MPSTLAGVRGAATPAADAPPSLPSPPAPRGHPRAQPPVRPPGKVGRDHLVARARAVLGAYREVYAGTVVEGPKALRVPAFGVVSVGAAFYRSSSDADGGCNATPSRPAPTLVVDACAEEPPSERRRVVSSAGDACGVMEWWLLRPSAGVVEVFRRTRLGLRFQQYVRAGDVLISPALPGFACFGEDLLPVLHRVPPT